MGVHIIDMSSKIKMGNNIQINISFINQKPHAKKALTRESFVKKGSLSDFHQLSSLNVQVLHKINQKSTTKSFTIRMATIILTVKKNANNV